MSERQHKPVPDVECLKYHGTPDKPDIKIFVSHRIDLDSETIDNPLYIPVRCGAVYDEREGVTMLGDDTGDNISEKRESFCEYTVMYWAWKNIAADYYGLCHYRRYLSFLDKDISGPALKQGILDSMSYTTLKECGLLNIEKISKQIEQADMVVPYEYSLKDAGINEKDLTIKEFWLKDHPSFLKEEHFDLMMALIKQYAPQYYNAALEYTKGQRFYGFNCFVMKKALFFSLCEFIFPILFAFDKEIDKRYFSKTQHRAAGYLGEWLFSIFIYYHCTSNKLIISERQILLFQNCEKTYQLKPAYKKNNIPIIMTLTDVNRPLIGVGIQSILAHANPEYNYDIILLQRSYDEDRWGTYLRKNENVSLEHLAEKKDNVSIRFYDPKNELLSAEVHEWGKPNTEELYYLLLCPWILEAFDKVVYIQEAMLIECDLSELLEVNIMDSYAAAPKSIFFAALLNSRAKKSEKNFEEKLRLLNPYNYVATDILSMNLKKVREDFSAERILKIIKERKVEKVPADGFNILFEGKIKFLPQKWNKVDCTGPEFFQFIEYFPAEEYQQQSEPPKALNLRGIGGGWLPIQSQPIREFWKYARETDFYEQILLMSIPNWSGCIFDLQKRMGLLDTRSGARKFADKLLPPGTRRREFAKLLLPKGSLRWRFCKQIYYIFRPKYRPKKEADI